MTKELIEILDKADLFTKEQKVKKYKIESDLSKIKQKEELDQKFESFSLDNIKSHQNTSEYANKQIDELIRNKKLLQQELFFINSDFSQYAKLYPGGVYLLGAISGTGKTTTSAAIAHGIIKQGKKVFLISTEEPAQNILVRLACMELNIDFNKYINNPDSDDPESEKIHNCIKDLTKHINIFDDKIGATTIETVEKILYEVDGANEHSCVIIDFAQRINKSKNNPKADNWSIMYTLKDILTDYAQHAKIPVILMSQLKPLSHKEKDRSVESRIKLCTGLYEVAACVIEIIRIPGIPVSLFHIEKSRFGRSNICMFAKYQNGKFITIDAKQFKELRTQQQLDSINTVEKFNEEYFGEE